jgi:hypothetical protein
MSKACEVIGVTYTKMKAKEWLKELESYGLIKIYERRDQEDRVALLVSSEEIKDCV